MSYWAEESLSPLWRGGERVILGVAGSGGGMTTTIGSERLVWRVGYLMLWTLRVRLYCCGGVVEGGLKARTIDALASGARVTITGSIEAVQLVGTVGVN